MEELFFKHRMIEIAAFHFGCVVYQGVEAVTFFKMMVGKIIEVIPFVGYLIV
jgi:hypothetical protein